MAEEPKFPIEGTRIDLGEDLLKEATRNLEIPKEPGEPLRPQFKQPADQLKEDLQRAQILLNERLLEDAKHALWKVLRVEPDHLEAKKLLLEIETQEIQELLSGDQPRKRFGIRQQDLEEDPKEVEHRLEHDLQLDMSDSELKPIPDLFRDEAGMNEYKKHTMTAIASLPARERIDLGIAHIEMGLFEVAIEVFETIILEEEFRMQGMYLLGLALIHGGKAIEATIRLEPIARDLTLTESQKTDFLYLMGLAFEKLTDSQKAKDFYRRVHRLNPKYRDIADKLK